MCGTDFYDNVNAFITGNSSIKNIPVLYLRPRLKIARASGGLVGLAGR